MSCKSFCWYTRTLLFLLLLPGSLGLRNVYMIIPEAVERGKPAVIRCIYDLENEDLYQVKWYRGDREFCRYSPRDVPPLKIFPLSGIDVDPEGSDAKQVTISAATKTAQGRFTCEVSADAPSFVTARIHGSMYVVDLPKSELEFIGLKPRYKPGMKLKAECISYDSMPPANMSFFVNNKPALSQHIWRRLSGGENGSLWTAYITLQFVVQRHHFIDGKLRTSAYYECKETNGNMIFKNAWDSVCQLYNSVAVSGFRKVASTSPEPLRKLQTEATNITVTVSSKPCTVTTNTPDASCNLKSLWTASYLALITLVILIVR